jgi:hypothetical protein
VGVEMIKFLKNTARTAILATCVAICCINPVAGTETVKVKLAPFQVLDKKEADFIFPSTCSYFFEIKNGILPETGRFFLQFQGSGKAVFAQPVRLVAVIADRAGFTRLVVHPEDAKINGKQIEDLIKQSHISFTKIYS